MTMRRLYYSVDLQVPPPTLRLTAAPALRSPVTYSVRQLSIRNGIIARTAGSAQTRRRTLDAHVVESFVQDVLDNVPTAQLTTFE